MPTSEKGDAGGRPSRRSAASKKTARIIALLLVLAAAALVAIVLASGGDSTERPRPIERDKTTPAAAPPSKLAPHKVSGPHDRPVPILMYHVITSPPPTAPYPELYVRAPDFAAQMRALAKRGYEGVTQRQVFDYWRRGIVLPRRPIVVSFDDGYLSIYKNALPILRKLRWPGVLNLEVQNMKESWGLAPRRVRELIKAGWELNAHSITHPDLTEVDPATLRREVAGSRTALKRQFEVPVDFFCYPAGRYDDATVAAVKEAGYLGATTTRSGLARPGESFTLPRVRVNGSDGVSGLQGKLDALGD